MIDSKLHLVWSQCCYSCDRSVSAKAVQLLIQLVIIQQQSGLVKESGPVSPTTMDLSQEAAMAVESLILNLCSNASEPPDSPKAKEEKKQLKIALASAVQLSCRAPEVGTVMVDCLVRLLLQSNGNFPLIL